MSIATLTATPDGFDDLEFALLVADFGPVAGQVDAEPVTPASGRRGRPSRAVARRLAIDESLGIRRHRTHEREA